MDVLEFVARSEWPLATVLALFLLRKPLVEMLDRVSPTKIDAWGFKAEFERTLDKVDALTGPLEEVAKTQRAAEDLDGAEKRSAEGLVLVSWQRLVSTLTELVKARDGEAAAQRVRTKPEEAARLLGLSDDEVQAIHDLRRLRNGVAHGRIEVVSESEAARFDDISWRLIGRLASIPVTKEV